MSAKQKITHILEQLPDDCSLEDVLYQLYVANTIQRRIEGADRGDVVSQEEAEERLAKWLTA